MLNKAQKERIMDLGDAGIPISEIVLDTEATEEQVREILGEEQPKQPLTEEQKKAEYLESQDIENVPDSREVSGKSLDFKVMQIYEKNRNIKPISISRKLNCKLYDVLITLVYKKEVTFQEAADYMEEHNKNTDHKDDNSDIVARRIWEKLYKEEEMGFKKIATGLGVSYPKIRKKLKESNIEIRKPGDTRQNRTPIKDRILHPQDATKKEILEKFIFETVYLDLELNMKEIADAVGISYRQVRNKIKKHRIPIRDQSGILKINR